MPEDTITGFQLRDIFDTTKKYSEIKKKLYETIMFNKRFPKSIGLVAESGTPKTQKKLAS